MQTRLAKYKDQLLEVKTNREYTAMLHEIEAAQNDIRTREDRILEIMMESDELNAGYQEERGGVESGGKGDRRRARGCSTPRWPSLQAEIDRTTAERAEARRRDRSRMS